MCNMKTVTLREVRHQFSRQVEAPLRRGETLIIRKRNKEGLGRVIPEVSQEKAYPDFAVRQQKIFGNKPPRVNVAEILRN